MSLSLKSILTLLITVLVFAGIFYLAGTELSDFVQIRFYNHSLTKSIEKETARDAELAQTHIFDLQKKFRGTLNEPAVLNSFLYNQNHDDIFERSKVFGLLPESVPGLQYVQFVDMNGIRLHYSTSLRDIISQNNNPTLYRNYTDDDLALPYAMVSVPAGSEGKYTMDEERGRIIFSFPFTDSMDVYRGTVLFTVSVRTLTERLTGEGRIMAADDISVISSPPGIVFGIPEASKIEILNKISGIWSGSPSAYVSLTAANSSVSYALITVKTSYGLYYGRLIDESIFSVSTAMKRILLLSFFFTFFLTLFFILNFRPEPAVQVRIRINKLRAKLVEQLYINKSGQERAKLIFELEQRRDGIRKELKSGLKLKKKGVNSEKNIDSIIDKSWDELLIFIKTGVTLMNDDKKIKQKALIIADETDAAGDSMITNEAAIADEIEELEELGEIIETDVPTNEAAVTAEAFDIDEIEELEELDETATADKAADETLSIKHGLLALASSGTYKHAIKTQKGRGLLALASSGKFTGYKSNSRAARGLLAAAGKIEFNKPASASTIENENNNPYVEINIVSPFSTMFSTLDDDE